MTDVVLQLGIILLGLFLAGRLAALIRLSVVPFYIGTGMLLTGAVAHSELVEFMSVMGVIFLLFYMGWIFR